MNRRQNSNDYGVHNGKQYYYRSSSDEENEESEIEEASFGEIEHEEFISGKYAEQEEE